MFNNNQIQYNPQIPTASTVPIQPGAQAPPAYAPQPGYAPQPSYGADQTSFSPSMPPPAPAVKVGLFDQMKSYFSDVYRTDANLAQYKQFQTTVDSNPYTLKPGSGDKQRVTDLQQKLNVAGINANVNGIYGYATGEAVKEFKTKMGISDGYLDGKGQPAVTDIATPQMQAVLNSVVSNKLNPNHQGPANPMPVTPQDIAWMQDLEMRSQQFGYKPNPQELARYNELKARQQANNQPGFQPQPQQPAPGFQPTPGYQPQQPPAVYQPPAQQPIPAAPAPTGVTQQELDWAFSMQERIMGGYTPSPQEAQAYEDIQARYAASQPTAPAPQPSGQMRPVTQAELDWATAMQDKIMGGYTPTQQEADRYTDIFNRYQNQPAAPQPTTPAQPTTPTYDPGTGVGVVTNKEVSPAEYQWALDLLYRIDSQGYQPTRSEVARYTDIYNRYQEQQKQPEPTPAPTPTQPAPSQPAPAQPQQPVNPMGATQEEADWARRLSAQISQGYKASPAELSKYNQIQMKIATYGVQEPAPASGPTGPSTAGAVVSQAEIDWALQLQHKVQLEGYQPTPDEVAAYTDIFECYSKMTASQQVQAPAPGPQTQQQMPQGVSQADIQWALELEQKVNGGYQPQPQEVARYQQIAAQIQAAQQQQPTPQPTQVNTPQPQPGVQPPSPQEIQWAQQLMQAVQQGYKASDQEMAQYTDIYNRMNAAQQQPQQQPQAPQYQTQPQPQVQAPAYTPPGSTTIDISAGDPELQWALDLLNRFRQGYQPSQSELVLYEQIIARKAVPNATP